MSRARRYEVRIKRAAEREMDALPKKTFRRIAQAVLSLETAPRSRKAKKLRGRRAYSLRVGDYRVLYTIDDAAGSVEVAAVGHRRDVYR